MSQNQVKPGRLQKALRRGGRASLPVRVLDPTGKYSSAYRRYAAVLFLPSAEPEPSFERIFVNRYNVLLPLRPDILDRLGVSLVLEVDLPANEGAISNYTSIGEREGLRLLKRDTR